MQRLILCVGALLASAAMLGGCEGCGEDDEVPLLASNTSVPEVKSAALEPEDAGPPADAGDGGAGGAEPAPKKKGVPAPSWLAKCCSALQHNLPTAPVDQKGAYLAAIGTCQAAMKNPALSGTLRAQLPKGSPTVCM